MSTPIVNMLAAEEAQVRRTATVSAVRRGPVFASLTVAEDMRAGVEVQVASGQRREL